MYVSNFQLQFRIVNVPMREFLQENLPSALLNQHAELIANAEEKLVEDAMDGDANVLPIFPKKRKTNETYFI